MIASKQTGNVIAKRIGEGFFIVTSSDSRTGNAPPAGRPNSFLPTRLLIRSQALRFFSVNPQFLDRRARGTERSTARARSVRGREWLAERTSRKNAADASRSGILTPAQALRAWAHVLRNDTQQNGSKIANRRYSEGGSQIPLKAASDLLFYLW